MLEQNTLQLFVLMEITKTQLKDLIIEVVHRFGVMQIDGSVNEISEKAIADWVERNYPHADENAVNEEEKRWKTINNAETLEELQTAINDIAVDGSYLDILTEEYILQKEGRIFKRYDVPNEFSLWEKARVEIESMGGKYTNSDYVYFETDEEAITFVNELSVNFPHIKVTY